ncbi:MAG: hypothetical protein EA343_09110 [Nodularia sp. (in: Bacteria)]|nr:MAG: hypothetical protein EA343_09110 [Nodularia sp. (in: cyanobacteria)]
MTIWIITTGNSDVQLKTHEQWEEFYEEVSYSENNDIGNSGVDFLDIQRDKLSNLFPVPARVLGIVYQNHLQENYGDLKFPLLDTFCEHFSGNNDETPSTIVVLLTDQKNIFINDEEELNEKVQKTESPYWQDTCKLEPILRQYFKEKNFKGELLFFTLTPISDNGLDHWENTLNVVEKTLEEVKEKLYSKLKHHPQETIYVSHQAGTPAISSAVQFVSLSKFPNVKFLCSNLFYEKERKSEPQLVDVSNYWRGMQIQKAKQLIIKGLPAAAKEILIGIVNDQTLAELNKIVDLFNINNSLPKGEEIQIKPEIHRVIIALDLVEIFFEQENYIQGVAILNATQETFLKAAILNQTKNINGYVVKLSSLVKWSERGLFIQSQRNIKKIINLQKPLDILSQLNFPVPEDNHSDFKFWNDYQRFEKKMFKLNNSRQFQWLCGLRQDLKKWQWQLLESSCQYKREGEEDLRNQLLHNLQGVKKRDLIKYLLGHKQDLINLITKDNKEDSEIVCQVYQDRVRKPFIKALKLFALLPEPPKENQLKLKLQEIANSLK